MTDFDLWMKKVDAALIDICGIGHDDLPDWMYMDAFCDARSDFDEIAREVLIDGGYEAFL
jgi:hypothetical protein